MYQLAGVIQEACLLGHERLSSVLHDRQFPLGTERKQERKREPTVRAIHESPPTAKVKLFVHKAGINHCIQKDGIPYPVTILVCESVEQNPPCGKSSVGKGVSITIAVNIM